MLADHAHVPASQTWEYINTLLDEGYTKAELAKALGYETPALQISKRLVTVRNAYDVKKMYVNLHGKRQSAKAPQQIITHAGGLLTQSKNKDGRTVLTHRVMG